jgi:hypothetical protein
MYLHHRFPNKITGFPMGFPWVSPGQTVIAAQVTCVVVLVVSSTQRCDRTFTSSMASRREEKARKPWGKFNWMVLYMGYWWFILYRGYDDG